MKSHVHVKEVEWTVTDDLTASYPEELRRVVGYRPLIGGNRQNWAGVPEEDVLMGVLELTAGATYPAHSHPSPEIYYVVSGIAEWTIGDETFMAEAGTAVYHAPNASHRMVNTGNEPRTVYF